MGREESSFSDSKWQSYNTIRLKLSICANILHRYNNNGAMIIASSILTKLLRLKLGHSVGREPWSSGQNSSTQQKYISEINEEAHVLKVMGSNSGAVYWTDITFFHINLL